MADDLDDIANHIEELERDPGRWNSQENQIKRLRVYNDHWKNVVVPGLKRHIKQLESRQAVPQQAEVVLLREYLQRLDDLCEDPEDYHAQADWLRVAFEDLDTFGPVVPQEIKELVEEMQSRAARYASNKNQYMDKGWSRGYIDATDTWSKRLAAIAQAEGKHLEVNLDCPICDGGEVETVSVDGYVRDGTEWHCECGAQGAFVEYRDGSMKAAAKHGEET